MQTNTAAAEVLYQAVIDECKLQQRAQQQQQAGGVILDVCCGTGTIGICAAVQLEAAGQRGVKRKAGEEEEGGAGQVQPMQGEKEEGDTTVQSVSGEGEEEKGSGGSGKLVLGVELCPTAVEDARVNAARNGVGNAVFVCAKGTHATRVCVS